MDSQHAFIISSEDYTPHGEFEVKAKVKCESHKKDDYKNDRVEMTKENAELKKYFKEISNNLVEVNNVYVFGPGKAQEQFKNFLKDQHTQMVVELDTADGLSEHQMVAKVKKHFG